MQKQILILKKLKFTESAQPCSFDELYNSSLVLSMIF